MLTYSSTYLSIDKPLKLVRFWHCFAYANPLWSGYGNNDRPVRARSGVLRAASALTLTWTPRVTTTGGTCIIDVTSQAREPPAVILSLKPLWNTPRILSVAISSIMFM